MKEVDGVDYAIVVDKVKKESKEKYLIGYYIPKNGNDRVDGSVIKKYLKEKLPSFMVPTYLIEIDKIPVTAHGKLDLKALPEPNLNEILLSNYVAPETDIEKKLCGMYSKLFKIDQDKIGRNTNFFELGGNSLNAVNISSLIEKEFKIKLNIKDIITYPSVASLASLIEKVKNSDDVNLYELKTIEKRNTKEFPVTSQQLGVYLDSIKNPESVVYNIPMSFKLNKNVDINKVFLSYLNHKKFSEVDIMKRNLKMVKPKFTVSLMMTVY